MDLKKTLEKLAWDELEKEGITKELVELVDINICFSPVAPFQNSPPCDVTETQGENFIVHTERGAIYVSPNELKIMRARYLQNDPDRVAQRNIINNIFTPE